MTNDNSSSEQASNASDNVRRNSVLIVVTQTMNALADALASAKIVLPWLMGALGVPVFFTGLLVPLRESGSLLPQLAIGNFLQRLAIRKHAYSVGLFVQAVCAAMIAVTAFTLQGWVAGLTILMLVAVMSLARAICSICSKDVLGKTIPSSRRGRILGLSSASAGGVTIIVGMALVVGLLSAQADLIWILAAAALCWLISALAIGGVREPEGETASPNTVSSQLKSGIGLLKEDSAFRRFVLVRTFLMSSSLSAPYFVLLAQPSVQGINLTGSAPGSSGMNDGVTFGLLIILGGLASLLSAQVWGRRADQSSRGVMLLTAQMTTALCGMAALLTVLPEGVITSTSLSSSMLALFFMLLITHQGVRLGRKTYVVNLSEGNQRTQYVATSNSIIGLMLLLTGVIAAGIAQFSITLVLIAFMAMGAIAALLSSSMPEADD